MSRRNVSVTAEDEAFFREAMQDVIPLERRAIVTSPAGLHRDKFVRRRGTQQSAQFVESAGAAPSLRGHAEARLRRGRLEPEARIDLHGHGYEGAYRALVGFLSRAYAEGKRLVLVITGKGGVLRPHLPLWLNGAELQDVVIGFREAHAKHGGGGAFYIALHSRRRAGARQ